MGLWVTFMEAIPAYTGLSPVTFFTLVAVLIGVYHLVSGMFAAPEQNLREFVPMEPLPKPVQLGEVTEEELKAYDGSDPKNPLLMAIKGNIYDVSQSRMFYGPGGPYALFAGRDASRALAKMSFEEKDLTGDLEGLGPFELDALQDWEYKFMGKYVKVGQLKKTNTKEVEVTEGTSNDGPETEHSVRDVNLAEDTPVSEAADRASPEKAEEPKENGSELKDDVDVTKANSHHSNEAKTEPVELSEASPEKAEEPKENGSELKDGVDVTKANDYHSNEAKTEPVELSEASEDAPNGKKIKEIVHESNHTAEVAQE